MSAHRDFDALVFAYLDGDATPEQLLALRDALRRDPGRRARLAALVRLHQAQAAVLGRARPSALAEAVSGLRRFADRAGRCLAHVCVLALVFVELDVAVPGVDIHAWQEPETSLTSEFAPDEETDAVVKPETASDEEGMPTADVREPDFLES